MAATNEGNAQIGRRGLLKAGAAAVGAALLPSPALASLDPASAEYRRTVESIALALKPGFEAGTLRAYNDADDERWDDEIRAGVAWGEKHSLGPMEALEDEIAARLDLAGDLDEATARRSAWVLMHSPSTPHALSDGTTIQGAAVFAATWDVLRIARERRWYVVTPGECPTNDDLGVRS